jgi:molybdopterin-containing oxidoreductase family iron-sulfur binding subunit
MADKCPSHSHRNDPADANKLVPWSDGKRYWRSLEELNGSPKFWEKVHREFPRYASEFTDDVSRRSFLKVMGASIALAGSAGCFKRPDQQIVPYVKQPELITPGVSLHFATALPMFGYARGVVVRSDEGRPTKIEGNKLHPSSLGATDAMTQALLLDLYDPDRSQTVINDGQISSWENLFTDPQNGIADRLGKISAAQGKGLVIMTETTTSPTVAAMLADLFKNLPQARWFRHDPVGRSNARDGAEAAFGKERRNVRPVYKLDQADVVLTLDGNFLADEPGSLAYARQFTDRRRVRDDRRSMNRLYAVEGTYTISGAMADHRLAVKPSRIATVARAIALAVGMSEAGSAGTLTSTESAFVKAVAADLSGHQGSSLVVVGDSQPAEVHALAHAINERLGNVGKTIVYIDNIEAQPADAWESLSELAAAMDHGDVEMLVIFDANPVYAKPTEVDFAQSLLNFSRAPGSNGRPRYISVRHGLYEDETSLNCQWHLPARHPLEAWGDMRGHDGTVTFCQPLISPLYDGRSMLEVLNRLRAKLVPSSIQNPPTDLEGAFEMDAQLVRAHWRQSSWQDLTSDTDFEIFWETCLHDGVVPKTASPALVGLTIAPGALTPPAAPASSDSTEIIFRADPNVWDGRFANNGWLQELPKPLSKITWDNAVLLSVATAAKLGVTNDDAVTLTLGNLKLVDDHAAVWILPGHADDCATVYLGYGRKRAGRVGNWTSDERGGGGFNAYQLRTAAAPNFAGGLQIVKQDQTYQIACTQGSQSMEGRDLIRVAGVDSAYATVAKEDAEETEKQKEEAAISGQQPQDYQKVGNIRHPLPIISMYPDTPDHTSGNTVEPQWQAWGMVIDNNTCIGCNACVIACVSENNIPVVGKDQVSRGREMHWLRIDTYFTGGLKADGVPDDASGDDAYHASTNRGALPGAQGLTAGDAGDGADASDVHAYFEPVPCMQCEKAPCEVVCPVGATIHDVEGINEMVYNRCVGTRYCSNNCPYKVRRFNFFLYSDQTTKSLALGRNPDVTVRTRGVMEKCTYCVQRISAARITAKKSNKYDDAGKPIIEDGTILTACQQVCPTQAIVFGDIGDATSQVRKLKEEPLNYVLLEELQTRPRTSYLWRLTNPNPELAKS